MIALSFEFLAGRYHATEWDHHVNEGTIEWPPSPWRILRALVSASYRAQIPEAKAWQVLRQLAEPPVYELPRAAHGHLRHYMPISGDKTTLLFDAFAAIEGGAASPAKLVAAWPSVTLNAEDLAVLTKLSENIGYLGRAESWTAATVLDDWAGTPNAVPSGSGSTEAPRLAAERKAAATISLPALQDAAEYAAWRRGFLDAQSGKKKRSPPENLWQVLHADTGQLQKEGWSHPPGTRGVIYELLEQPFAVTRTSRTVPATPVKVVRFRVTSPVLPTLKHALSIGERMRQAVMSHSNAVLQRQLPIFCGKNANGDPVQGHGHAYWLGEDHDSDGSIDHLVGYAPDGFDGEAIRVLHHVRRLWGAEGHDLELVLIESGEASDLGTTLSEAFLGKTPLLGEAREWISRTPFVPPRHLKKGDFPEQQILRLLQLAGHAAAVKVESYDAAFQDEPQARHKPMRWLEFRRERFGGAGARGSDRGYGFRLTFETPVRGPIALGYGAHFGLGQFVAVR